MTELALHILDIVQNSIRAKAALAEIYITEDPQADLYQIEISDNGPGMDAATLSKVTDPFFTSRSSRKVGLGLPLLKQAAEQTQGKFTVESAPGAGTTVKATFRFSHIDRPVLGDIAGTILILLNNEADTEIVYRHRTPQGEFNFDSREIRKILGDVPIASKEIREFIGAMLIENLEQIQISE